MTRHITAALGLFLLAACNPGEDTARVGEGADTLVTTRQEMDTAIVTQDTTVSVDTVEKEGDRAVGKDTVKR
jgi:hypothetical protein